MIPEINDLTWQSLHEYIERRITGVLEALQLIRMDSHANDFAHMSTSLEYQLELLRWCLPLVEEMQIREDMQVVCPIMSLELIRLRCRSQNNNLARLPDFAWITPVANGRYSLMRRGMNQSQELETLWSFEGDLPEIVKKVETLVKEICTNANP